MAWKEPTWAAAVPFHRFLSRFAIPKRTWVLAVVPAVALAMAPVGQEVGQVCPVLQPCAEFADDSVQPRCPSLLLIHGSTGCVV